MKSLRIDTNKKFKHYGEKIKSLNFHPTQNLLLASQYNGKLVIFNYESQQESKVISVSEEPLRCSIWLNNDQIACVCDDKNIRVFNYHTTQKLMQFQGHDDFVRKLVYNPSTNEIVSCSDDKSIIVWEYNKQLRNYVVKTLLKEHKHFIMDLQLSPREEGVFASASLDATIKFWNFKSEKSNGTLRGHSRGVNCIDFYAGDKNLLISGGDDFLVIVWDLGTRSILAKLKNHNENVTAVSFMQKLPIFTSLSEDGMLNFYSLKDFRFQFDIMNFMNKGWALCGKNSLVAAGYDEGCVVIQVGNDKPLTSCVKGKVMWTANSEVFSANLKAQVTKGLSDFEELSVSAKEHTGLEIFPQNLQHSPNGQLVAFYDHNEYVIFKSLSFKLVLYGSCQELVWGDNNSFALLNSMNEVEIRDSKGNEVSTLKFDFYVNNIHGGRFLALCTSEFVLFYDWAGENCVGKINVELNEIFWHRDRFVIKGNNAGFLLQFNEDQVGGEEEAEVFSLVSEIGEDFYSGYWHQNLFFYVSKTNKFKVLLGDKAFVVATLKHPNIILDYVQNHQRFFFFDNNSAFTTFALSKALLRILDTQLPQLEQEAGAKDLLKAAQPLPDKEKDFLAQVLIHLGHKRLAFQIVANLRQKFDLAIELKYLEKIIDLCKELQEPIYWKKLGDLALVMGDFPIAESAFIACQDSNSLLLLAVCLGDKTLLLKTAEIAESQKHFSVSFLAYWNGREVYKCLQVLLDTQRFSEAAIFCKNYIPSKIKEVFELWKAHLA
jgi:coatomer subunit beta'